MMSILCTDVAKGFNIRTEVWT